MDLGKSIGETMESPWGPMSSHVLCRVVLGWAVSFGCCVVLCCAVLCCVVLCCVVLFLVVLAVLCSVV